MTEEEIKEMVANDMERHGWHYYAEYIRRFGNREPIVNACIFEGDFERRERIAKQCVEAGKTATELGLYKPLPKGARI